MTNTEAKHGNKDSIETNEDLYKVFYWYQKTAENGNINAQHNLALSYYNGEGTEKNLEKAFYWYQKAAEYGCEIAQYNLALLYKKVKEQKRI